MRDGEVLQDQRAERMADETRLRDPFGVEHRLQIVDPAGDRERTRSGRAARAFEVEANQGEAVGERAHLRLPDVGRAAQAMQQQHRLAAALLLDRKRFSAHLHPHRPLLQNPWSWRVDSGMHLASPARSRQRYRSFNIEETTCPRSPFVPCSPPRPSG
jgi:hypothetical protein